MIIKQLEKIAKLNSEIFNIKKGNCKQTKEKTKNLINEFKSKFNYEDFAKKIKKALQE